MRMSYKVNNCLPVWLSLTCVQNGDCHGVTWKQGRRSLCGSWVNGYTENGHPVGWGVKYRLADAKILEVHRGIFPCSMGCHIAMARIFTCFCWAAPNRGLSGMIPEVIYVSMVDLVISSPYYWNSPNKNRNGFAILVILYFLLGCNCLF